MVTKKEAAKLGGKHKILSDTHSKISGFYWDIHRMYELSNFFGTELNKEKVVEIEKEIRWLKKGLK